jgi:hypothetical protein
MAPVERSCTACAGIAAEIDRTQRAAGAMSLADAKRGNANEHSRTTIHNPRMAFLT